MGGWEAVGNCHLSDSTLVLRQSGGLRGGGGGWGWGWGWGGWWWRISECVWNRPLKPTRACLKKDTVI